VFGLLQINAWWLRCAHHQNKGAGYEPVEFECAHCSVPACSEFIAELVMFHNLWNSFRSEYFQSIFTVAMKARDKIFIDFSSWSDAVRGLSLLCNIDTRFPFSTVIPIETSMSLDFL
jgi:hypothetical protein